MIVEIMLLIFCAGGASIALYLLLRWNNIISLANSLKKLRRKYEGKI